MRESQPPVDQELVKSLVADLSKRNDKEFENALIAYIIEPNLEETAAFRSWELAQRSARIVGLLRRECERNIEQATIALRRNSSDMAATRHLARNRQLRNLLGSEGAALRHIANAVQVQRGEDPTAPNANSRALRALKAEYPQRFLELKRDAEAEIAAERAEAKKRRRADRVAEKAAERGAVAEANARPGGQAMTQSQRRR